jgi:hypothetical protein
MEGKDVLRGTTSSAQAVHSTPKYEHTSQKGWRRRMLQMDIHRSQVEAAMNVLLLELVNRPSGRQIAEGDVDAESPRQRSTCTDTNQEAPKAPAAHRS